MNSRYPVRRLALPAMAMAMALAALSACGSGGGEGIVLAPTSKAIQDLSSAATYTVVLVNAADGSTITDPITLTFTGSAALVALDGSSLNGKSLVTQIGVAPLAARFTASASDFSVLAGNRALGWLDTGTRVVAKAGASGDQTITLRMMNVRSVGLVNASDKPLSMAVATVSTDASGAIAAPVAQSTAPKTVRNAEGGNETIGVATLAIPAGTSALTAGGSRITPVGPLTVSTVYFGTSNADSLNAFPGGFSASVVGRPPGSTVDADAGVFITGGFAQFNVVDANGQALTNFDRPLTVSIDVPRSTRSDDGSRLVAVGDKFPVWSYDQGTGRWVFEREGILAEKAPADPNNVEVRFPTTHLSSWNVDYWDAACTGTVLVTRGADTRPLEIEVTGLTGWRYSKTAYGIRDNRLDLIRIPLTDAMVNIYDNTSQPGRVLVAGQAGNPCAGMTIDLTGKLPDNSNAGVVSIDVTESCEDGSGRRALPTNTMLLINGFWNAGYAAPVATAGGSVARLRHGDLLPGVRTAYAWNPRSNSFSQQQVTVVRGQTVTAAFNFPMACSPITGA